MDNIIIFKIELGKKSGGFAKASNFISKMSRNENLSLQEVHGITTIRYNGKNVNYRDIAEYTSQNREHFKRILKPENLSASSEYRVYYCLWIENESLRDLIDLQYDCLMKKFFKTVNILSVLNGPMDLYFKASHYLYSISCMDNDLYNRIFYKQASSDAERIKLQRLQIKNAGKFNDFMPLQYFSEDQKGFTEELKLVISKDNIQKVLVGANERITASPVLQTGLELLHNAVGDVTEEKAEQIARMLCKGDIFTFLLFAYSFMNKSFWKKTEMEVIIQHYDKIREWAMGCEQLIENIIHHSVAKSGCVSIRIHERRSKYLQERYQLEEVKDRFVEILITDYAGINTYGNLADNFRMTQGVENELKETEPVDFLMPESEQYRKKAGREALVRYLHQSDNIGKHVGLKIFRKIVEDNDGTFGFYSHRTHILAKGENYRFIEYSEELCMPGTGYTVLFPIKLKKQEKEEIYRAEIGIDYNIDLKNQIQRFINGYDCLKKSITNEELSYDSQTGKEKSIAEIAEKLALDRYRDDGARRIVYMSAESLDDRAAEYLCKAILIASGESDIPDFVFFDCTKGFLHVFQQNMAVYFGMPEFSLIYRKREFVTAFYTKEPVECCFIIPGHYYRTILANRTNCYLGSEYDGVKWLSSYRELYKDEKEKTEERIPPYDILYEISSGGTLQTIFEIYTKQILETDIQQEGFGCKIENTHMRLGSTIHISSFYEAELLFNNRLFVSRFAYLLVKDILKSPQFVDAQKVTLYSYALYSETLIVEVMDIFSEMFPKKDIDYAIFEREADHREFSHIDRIRYSNNHETEEERKAYFLDRKIICIVPINSTLKTHEKMLNQFQENNGKECAENIILNYALILIGSLGSNNYWQIDEGKKTFASIKLNIKPYPRYFISIKVKYYEANCCELCFPKEPIAETPLVEVNAASTIPNQAIGLYGTEEWKELSYDEIRSEEESLRVLKESLIYGHTQRGENHFLYYFKTDDLFLKQKKEIIKWLKEVSKSINVDMNEYHVLFCPSHFSNTGFMEYINRIVFHEAALVIRVDVDKEYRSNICAKYSNLALLIRLLDTDEGGAVKLYYVDDSIITGRTFFRARSLVSSIINRYRKKNKNMDIRIFEKVFVLLDRNSPQSRLQYIGYQGRKTSNEEWLENGFFAFRTLHISSMRNHGDSCTLCQLQREADILYRSSATKQMASYWKSESEKFQVRQLKDKEEERIQVLRDAQEEGGENVYENDTREKAFRRMFCCHMATIALDDEKHGNKKESVAKCLLDLLLKDYNGRKKEQGQEEAFEYFVSYLKIVSRPFIVFNKTIKEVVFDVLLFLAEGLFEKKQIADTWKAVGKTYIAQNEKHVRDILNIVQADFTKEQRLDLMKILMKQITEMKGNYFIRSENIHAIAKFVADYVENEKESLYDRFLQQTKKLLGVSSDTSKSAWFSREIYEKEKNFDLPDHILGRLLLENTRAYYDGLEKLCKKVENISLNDELKKAQYRDYCAVLSDIGLYDIEKKCVLKDRENEVQAGVELLALCKKSAVMRGQELSDRKIEEICHDIVGLMNKILCAEEVKLLLECPMECDKWEDHIRAEFNELAKQYEEAWEEDRPKVPKLELENRKKYLVIADSKKANEFADWFIEGATIDVAEKLRDFHNITEKQNISEFYINKEDAYMIWEIGNSNAAQKNQRRLLVYAEFSEIRYPEAWYKIRNLLCLREQLNKSVFNEDVIDYLFELMLADEKGMLYELDRALTHTKENVRRVQIHELSREEDKEEYRSFVLTLLSDLQVSRIYRESLKEDFYHKRVNLHVHPRKKIFSIYHEGRPLAVVDQEELSRCVYLYLEFPEGSQCRTGEYKLGEEENFLTYAVASGADDVCLLLTALIMNAAGARRGIGKNDEKHEGAKKIVVYLTKTEGGSLRIANRCDHMERSVEEINRGLKYPPKRNEGISLWSMSRYIKSIIATRLDNWIYEIKRTFHCFGSKEEIQEEIRHLKNSIEKLLGGEYDVKVGTTVEDDVQYFYMDIPILAEKYSEFRGC